MAAALRSQARLRALDALIRVEGPVHVIDIVRDLWAWCLDDASADQPTITLALPDVLLDPSPEMLLRLTSRINDAAIQSRSGLDVLLHAAGICTPSGTVCALVGPSGAGKTTAALTLGQDRWGYVTDETVAIDAVGTVRAFPKPLALVGPPQSEKHLVSPARLGMQRCPERLRVGALVYLDRDRSHSSGPSSLESLDLLDAVELLAAQCSALTQIDQPLHRLKGLVESTGGMQVLHYREIGEIGALLTGTVARHEPISSPRLSDGMALPRPESLLDAVATDHGALVLTHERMIRLTPLGILVWRLADAGMSHRAILRECIRAEGQHPDASELVASCLDLLRSANLISVSAP